MSGEFVAFVVVIVFVASAMLLRRQRSRITVGDEQGLPPELHGAEIAFAERTFRSQRRQFVARLDRAYRTAGGLHLVELKTRERDAVYISDVIELSVQRIAVEDEAGEPVSGDAWAMAVKDTKLVLPDDFYEQELEQVILAQGIATLEEYRTARRIGRSGVLSRSKRDAVWPVFEEYRGQLAWRKLKEVDDTYREVATMLHAAQAKAGDYSAVVVDETQDFGQQALKLLRALIPPGPNDLFFVGDGHQRIYSRHRAAMSKCGIDIRGRSRKLYLNYRTTDEIRRQAVALLEGCEVDDLDDGLDETKRYKSLSRGPAPVLVQAEGLETAAAQAIGFIKALRAEAADGQAPSVCVIASSGKTREAMAKQLLAAGLAGVTITAQSNHGDARDTVHFATMHRAKGLEFDAVVVVAPQSYFGDVEQTVNQRKLMYVALTRAKRAAMLIRVG